MDIYPAKHYLAGEDRLKQSIANIEKELEERVAYYKANEKLLEAQRIEQRTQLRPGDAARGRHLRRASRTIRASSTSAPPAPIPGR